MAALLVGLAVMAVVLSVAMPTWSHMIRREKEEELIFRGTQYARAINQYQRKFANASPQNLDVLIEQRMLRKKFRDPFSTTKEGEFQMLYLSRGSGPQGPGAGMGAGSTGTGGRGLGAGPQTGTGTGLGSSTGTGLGTGTGTSPSMYSTTPSGGIVGVASKNTGTSIKIYKEKTKYNEWQFVGLEQSTRGGSPSGGGPGGMPRGGIGGREGRGGRTITTGPDGTFIGPPGGGFGSGGRGGPDRGRGMGRGTGPNPSR
jgi:type II secretory pathway pseudopilin PulG